MDIIVLLASGFLCKQTENGFVLSEHSIVDILVALHRKIDIGVCFYIMKSIS